MRNNKVLITGGRGFIGRHLTRKLVETGKDVVVLDATVPRDGNGDSHDVQMMIKGDIRDGSLVGSLMKNVDTVYHLAAVTTFDECRDDPKRALDINAHGTATVLEEAIRHDASSFVFFSSASVYSGNEEPVKHEEMKLKPQSIYGITKLMGEKLCEDAVAKYGLSCTVLRPFNVYGEGGRGVVNRFVDAAKGNNHTITIYGDGSQTRDYIHVDDVVQAAIVVGEAGLAKVCNVGTGEGCSLLKLRGLIEQLSGVSLTLKRKPREPWDLQELIADTRRAREVLSITAPLMKGLTMLLEEEGKKEDRDTRKSLPQAQTDRLQTPPQRTSTRARSRTTPPEEQG